jgi:hypothetical protein
MHQEEGFKFCLDTKNNKAFPFNPACLEHLNVWSPSNLPYLSKIIVPTSEWEIFILKTKKRTQLFEIPTIQTSIKKQFP